MKWLLVGLGCALVLGLIWLRIRRRWIEPWAELEQLVTSILNGKTPRKFLMTGNERANVLGLGLEQFALKQRELEVTAAQGTNSLQSILGALPDGLALVDQQRRVQVMNPQFRQLFGLREDLGAVGLLEIVRDAVVERAVAAAIERGELRTEAMTLSHGLETKRELEVTVGPFTRGKKPSRHAGGRCHA